jgi:hypothetical protein
MLRKLSLVFLLFAVTLLVAADPSWIGKSIAEWTRSDAAQVLNDSPWASSAMPVLLPALSPFARRDAGNMVAEGGGEGMQLDRLKDFNVVDPRGERPRESESAHLARMPIRWESALPIRTAQLKAPIAGAPEIDDEDYAIAVYGVSLKFSNVDEKGFSEALKKFAALKIEGRKELRPSRIAVLNLGDGTATVVYFFPRSARITVADKRLEFDAQIGRLAVAQYFYPPRMQLQGRLEL